MFQTGFQYTPVDSIATCVTPHSRSQSVIARRSCVKVANRRFSCFFLPFGKAHNTQAVMLLLCTSRPAQRSYTTSTIASPWPRCDGCRQKKRFSYACSPQLPEATIRCASAASGPYSYAGWNQRQSSSASIVGWLIEKTFAGYRVAGTSTAGGRDPRAFSSFVVVRRTMIYSYRKASMGSTDDARRAGMRVASAQVIASRSVTAAKNSGFWALPLANLESTW